MKFFIKIIIFILFLLLFLNPSFGISEETKKSFSYEIVFGIDTSLSMLADDNMEKNRFERGKEKIFDIVNSLNGEFGLLEFSSKSYISIPFTSDKNSFSLILKKLEINKNGDFGSSGTNFKSISSNLDKIFDLKKDKEKVLILISDGGNLLGDFGEEDFNYFKDNKIKILNVGFGTKVGSKILLGEDKYGKQIFKKYRGEDVVSVINDDFLKNISDKTGGKYFYEKDKIGDIIQFIENKFERKNILEKNIEENKYFQFFAFLIFLLIIIEMFLFKIFKIIKKHINFN